MGNGQLRLFIYVLGQVYWLGFGTEPKLAMQLWEGGEGAGRLAKKFGIAESSVSLQGGQLEEISDHWELWFSAFR